MKKKSFENRGLPHKIGKCFSHVFNAAGLCMFVVATLPHGNAVVESLNAVTGWDMKMADVLNAGERIANMRHAFNIREGLNPREYDIPDRIMGRPPKTKGPNQGVVLNEDEMYNDFLRVMDWDLKTTRPSREKLIELGLGDVADELGF
jgi:aldehyde:ferredoxin oxidoreductase